MNESGIWPVECKCLVLPDEVPTKTAGGIDISVTADKEQQAQVKGTLVAAGPVAFEDWSSKKIPVGTRVFFAKYAGIYISGDDGKQYRLINDNDIMAVCNE